VSLTKKRNPSRKQVEANHRNAQKSTGPRTPQGKAHVALNALKHGLHSDPFVQGMLALHEDPRAYYRLLGELLTSLRPSNPHQRLQVEDIARLRLEKQRLQRARAGLVVGKVRGLELRRDRRQLDFDCEAPDLPQAELLEKGLYRAPDSPPKFEKMLSCFDVLINEAKQGRWRLDPEPELNLLYGKEPSLEGAYLRNVFRRCVAAKDGVGLRPSESRAARAAERGDGVSGGSGSGAGGVHQRGEGGAAHSAPNPESRTPNPEGTEGEPERLLLLRTLFAAKQRALRLYQLYNREFVEVTPDQRDVCLAPSDRTDVNLMRQEAQNERQLRWALKLYWQTQKEDAARPAQPEGEADDLVEALAVGTLTPSPSPTGRGELEPLEVLPSPSGREGTAGAAGEGEEPISSASAPGISELFGAQQSHQPAENTEELSGIGQNKPNSAIADGRLGIVDWQAGAAGPSVPAIENGESSIKGSMEAARPKVKELLEQMQSDPEARALVETFLLSQMVEEDSRREEQELAAWQREKHKREALEDGLEQMVAAQQELEGKNRQLRAELGESELMHQQVREQVKPAEAAVATRREPTHMEIYNKIREVVGLTGGEEFFSDTEAEDMPADRLREDEFNEFQQAAVRPGNTDTGLKNRRRKKLDRERVTEQDG
jgi:hypothetical protein